MQHLFAEGSCQVCAEPALRPVEHFPALLRVTSDCRPFKAGGNLTVCDACGAVQKIADAQWLGEIGEIYSRYAAYELADGEEQIVLDPLTGQLSRRSDVLLQRIGETGLIKHDARVLDVGCGNGVTLRAMARTFPEWTLYGHELDGRRQDELKRIKGFDRLFAGALADIPLRFDLISMVHSLEHFPQPRSALTSLHGKAERNGRLFIEVCNVDANPFDLLVADHLMHFSPVSLARLVEGAGYRVARVETGWIKKEISLLGTAIGTATPAENVASDVRSVRAMIEQNVRWLERLVDKARMVCDGATAFGLFGTSIAASWLAAQLGDQVRFFVDEDTNRAGKAHLGKPVLLPRDVPSSSVVLLSLAPALADAVRARLDYLPITIVQPPALEA